MRNFNLFNSSPIVCLILLSLLACNKSNENTVGVKEKTNQSATSLIILGVAQDAGYPQAGCMKDCCRDLWTTTNKRKSVVSIGLVDASTNQKWMIDATPNIKDQLFNLHQFTQQEDNTSLLPDGIFLTHGHIGHYTGLMQLGKEVMGTKAVPVYAMPRMSQYLSNNGPWSQLVKLENIRLQALRADSTINLTPNFRITPFLVPHRDEFTETVGYKITGTSKSAIFIPDIDKWSKWDKDIIEEIKNVDYAFLDGSFYKNGEIPGRDMRLIPHPFMEESLALFEDLTNNEKAKIYFIHFNHTNPVLDKNSEAYQEVIQKGFNIAEEGMRISL